MHFYLVFVAAALMALSCEAAQASTSADVIQGHLRRVGLRGVDENVVTFQCSPNMNKTCGGSIKVNFTTTNSSHPHDTTFDGVTAQGEQREAAVSTDQFGDTAAYLTISSQRHGSEGVASHFKDAVCNGARVGGNGEIETGCWPENHTYGISSTDLFPNKLNFLVTGNMTVSTGDGMQVVLPQLTLAQGHQEWTPISSESNNWWIGGPFCQTNNVAAAGSGGIQCFGNDEDGMEQWVFFSGGSNIQMLSISNGGSTWTFPSPFDEGGISENFIVTTSSQACQRAS